MAPTGNKYTSGDRFLLPHSTTRGTKLVLRENGVDRVIDLAQSYRHCYYGHSEQVSPNTSPYRGMWDYLVWFMENADSGTNNTYKIELRAGGRPDDTLFARYVYVERLTGFASWAFNFDHPEWTLDKTLLGELPDATGLYGGGDSWVSSLGSSFYWQPPVVASDKRRVPKKTSFAFSKAKSSSIWTSMASWDVRVFEYQFVHAPHVLNRYASNETRANDAGLEQHDDHNTFERLWSAAPDGPIIVLYDRDYEWGQTDAPKVYYPYEILKWVDTESLEDLERNIEPIEDAVGEQYHVKFEMAIIDGGNSVDTTIDTYDH